jgi:hypothetical protein
MALVRARMAPFDDALHEPDGGDDGTGVDDDAATSGAHVWDDGPRHVGDTEHVDGEHTLPVVGCALHHIADGADAGVVAQHIDASILVDHTIDRGRALRRVGEIEAVGQVEPNRPVAGRGEARHHRAADATGRPGDPPHALERRPQRIAYCARCRRPGWATTAGPIRPSIRRVR